MNHSSTHVLDATQNLESVGFSREQADMMARVVIDMQSDLATKQDVNFLWKFILGVLVPLHLLTIGLILAK